MVALNPASTLPLYAQLAERLLAQIRAQEWQVGQRLPSETALAQRYRIGRPTVRQATEWLMRRGYVERRRGSGTYVVEPSRSVDLFSLGGTLQSFAQTGLNLVTEWLNRPTVESVPLGAHPIAGRPAYFLRRVGKVSERVVLLESFWLDCEVFPHFEQRFEQAKASLSTQLQELYRVEPTSAEQRFYVAPLARDEAQLFDLELPASVLGVDRTLHLPSALSAVFVSMRCHSEQISFAQKLDARSFA